VKGYIVTGRWEDVGKELFTLKDRHDKEFVLSPVGKQTQTNYILK
jgi:prolyl-tRNA synthetase